MTLFLVAARTNVVNGPKQTKKGKTPPKPKGAGRPTRYQAEFAEQALKLCRLGATDKELADFFGVDVRTIDRWKHSHAEFCRSLKKGKSAADAEVADRLYQRALGFSHAEDKILQHNGIPVIVPTVRHYAPDTLACIYWLKNRRPDLWRDKVNLEHTGPNGGPIQTSEEYRPSSEDEAVVKRIAEKREEFRNSGEADDDEG